MYDRHNTMKFVLITKDTSLEEEAKEGFHPSDTFISYSDWESGLDGAGDADLVFLDLLATLDEPHKIAGYEKFAHAKMSHSSASKVPLVLISPPENYELDFMAGWPDFVFANIQRPVTFKHFRRASTWV
jgi:hypothetical protein